MDSLHFAPIIVTTTSDDRAVLDRISQQLVSMKLAACVQISGPITSCYRWQGKIESSTEWLCVIKSSRQRFEEVEKVVLDLHNYDQPQLVAVKIMGVNAGYLKWLEDSVAKSDD